MRSTVSKWSGTLLGEDMGDTFNYHLQQCVCSLLFVSNFWPFVIAFSFFNSHLSFESRSCWDLNYEDEKYKGDGCYKGRHCHHEHCFDEVCNLPSPADLPFLCDVDVKMGWQCDVCI